MNRFPILLPALLALALPASAQEPPLELVDLEGTVHAPLVIEAPATKAAVFFFVSPFCPTSNTFQPEMNAIAAEHADDFAFYCVHADPGVSLDVALQHRELTNIPATVLIDQGQRLARKLDATITPEAVVVGPDGQTLYQGRINDLYLGPTKRQREPTTRDLRDALEAIRDGRAAPSPRTEAVGCDLPGVRG